MDLKIKDFLDKLNLLSQETGVYIEPFGDQYYNPKLVIKSTNNENDGYWLSFNEKTNKHFVSKGDPYSNDDIIE